MPKVSVIIPVYNVEQYLRECLDSVVNQTLKDIEIICVNDGSTDNSLEILKEYASKDDRVKVIEQENQGAGAARNLGLTKALGNYIIFLDSDDFFELDLLEKMYNNSISLNTDISICLSNTYVTDENRYKPCGWFDNIKILPDKKTFNKYDIPNDILNFCNIATFTKLYKREFLEKYKFRYQEIKTCNDVYFNSTTLTMAESIAMVPEVLIHRIRGHICLSTNRGKNINCILLAAQETQNFLKKKRIFNLVKISFYKRIVRCFNYEIKQLNTKKEKRYWTYKLYNFLPKEYWSEKVLSICNKQKEKQRKKFIEKLFSIKEKKSKKHNIITVLGIKIKIRRRNG